MSLRASVGSRHLCRPWSGAARAVAILLGSALLAAAPATARAEADDYRRFLDAAARLHEALEYERALQHVRSARTTARTADQQADVSVYEAVLLAELNRLDEARTSFKEAFLLKPEAQLPVRVAPRIQAEAEAARQQARAELAALRAKQDARRGQELAGGPDRAAAPPPRADTPVLDTTRPTPETRLAPVDDTPAPPLAPLGELAPAPRAPQGISRRPPFVAIAFASLAVGAAGAGTLFGLQSRTHVAEARAASYQDVAAASLGDARGAATTANVLFGSAGALALGALVSGIVWLSMPATAEAPGPLAATLAPAQAQALAHARGAP